MAKIPIWLIIAILITLGDFRIAVAATGVKDRVATCTNKYAQRRVVTLDYLAADSQAPCQVIYEKPTEKRGSRQVLWRAKNSVGYCERKMNIFLRKLDGYGWQCSYKMSSYQPSYEPPVTVARQAESYTANCGGQKINLKKPLTKIAKKLTGLRYDSRKLQDCSGIFYQVIRKFKREYCPNYDYPSVSNARYTRDIAKWYHQRGELVLVHDPYAKSHLIKPGAVMFFGHKNRKYKNFQAKDLFVRGTGINHMGVVTSVKLDATGQVVSYQLFHGRRPGRPSKITNFHKRKSTRSYYPPFGNGREQWVAMAPLVKQLDSEPPAKPDSSKVVKALTGEASYYADSLHGRRTASGKLYDKNKLTAAHRTLPFGTRARVTYLKTGKSVEVVINDRGPYHKKRIIDLSRKAAKKIGLIRAGHGKVKVEILK